MGRRKIITALGLGVLGAFSSPLFADVKAGVDAWTRGDFSAAVQAWEAEAAKDDADAIFNLGQAYKLGKGVKQDLQKAEALFGQAAAMGHLQAADNYGLLVFQRGDHAKALPYIRAASDRGDPRAQYLLGLMHFNGELVAKDWVRAYALETLARQQGLPQAAKALAQMDQYVPIEQRQQAVQLAGELASQADATRARQLAAADLGTQASANTAPAYNPATAAQPGYAQMPQPRPVAVHAGPPPGITPPPPRPAPQSSLVSPAQPTAGGGTWRIQFGAFGVAANADALWAKVKGRPEVAGHPRINAKAGAITKLQAGGYSQAGAQAACGKLKAAGLTCVAVTN